MRRVFRFALTSSLATVGALLFAACSSSSSAPDEADQEFPETASPWDCFEEADAFGDLNLGCVSLGETVSGERLALVMTCYTADGDDGLWDYNVIRATVRGDLDFGKSPNRMLDEFADIALDDGEREQIGIYRRGDHFTINHDPWADGRGSSQWDTLMNKLKNHQRMTIRLTDAQGQVHSGVIQTEFLEEPLDFLESRGCERNVPLY